MPARGQQSGGLTRTPTGRDGRRPDCDSATEVVGDLATLFAEPIGAISTSNPAILGYADGSRRSNETSPHRAHQLPWNVLLAGGLVQVPGGGNVVGSTAVGGDAR